MWYVLFHIVASSSCCAVSVHETKKCSRCRLDDEPEIREGGEGNGRSVVGDECGNQETGAFERAAGRLGLQV